MGIPIPHSMGVGYLVGCWDWSGSNALYPSATSTNDKEGITGIVAAPRAATAFHAIDYYRFSILVSEVPYAFLLA